MRSDLIYAGAHRELDKLGLRKAGLNPLTDGDFLLLTHTLAEDLAEEAQELRDQQEQRSLRLIPGDFDELPEDEQNRIIVAIALLIGASVAAAAWNRVRPIIDASVHQHIRLTADAASTEVGYGGTEILGSDILSDVQDSAKISVINAYRRRSNVFLARAGKRLTGAVKPPSEELRALIRTFSTGADAQYWPVIAMDALAYARTRTQLSVYRKKGVRRVQWVSVLDDRTTMYCQMQDGKIYTVDEVWSSVESAIGDRVNKSPFVRDKHTEEGIDLVAGTGDNTTLVGRIDGHPGPGETPVFSYEAGDAVLSQIGLIAPPAHAFCRSRLVPLS